MPLSDQALADVASVRRWIGDAEVDEDLVEDGVNGVSQSILRWTGRQFAPEVGVTKRFVYDGEGILDLTSTELRIADPVVTPLVVTAYSDLPASEQLVLVDAAVDSEGDYRLEPRQGTSEGTYLWLVLPRLQPRSSSTTGYQPSGDDKLVEISVEGDWGADQVPPDVKLACIEEVARLLRNPEGVQDRAVGPFVTREAEDASSFGLSRRCRERLRPFKRTNVA